MTWRVTDSTIAVSGKCHTPEEALANLKRKLSEQRTRTSRAYERVASTI